MPRTGAVRARAGGSRRYSDQGSEQPGAELYQNEAGEGVGARATRGCRVISTGSTRPTGKTRAAPAAAKWRTSGEKIAAIQGRRERFEEHRDALAASGEDQLSLTDPDSRAMHAATRVGVGYNIQIAVDAKHKLIAEQQVHSKVSDLGLLAETAVAARRNLAVYRIDAVADAGYFKDRGYRGLRECRRHAACAQAPARINGEPGALSQGTLPL